MEKPENKFLGCLVCQWTSWVKQLWPPSVLWAVLGSHKRLHPRPREDQTISSATWSFTCASHSTQATLPQWSQTSCEVLQRLVLIHTESRSFINQLYFTEQSLHNHNQHKLRSKECVKVISWRSGEEVIHSLVINQQFPIHQGPVLYSIRLYETCRVCVCREHGNCFNYNSFD